jgi:hypothetical protein
MRVDDPGMAPIVERVLAHQDPCGPFQVSINVPSHFGGTGKDTWGWALCDAPLLLYALARFGLGHDPRVRQGVEHLVGLLRPNGWPCAVSGELGKFRGPGRKDDPCPYATLIMLKLLVQLPGRCEGEAVRTGAEMLLRLWAERREQHPYMFYMGTDFCKAKAPLVWYDIVHVLDVLSQVPGLQTDHRLVEMTGILRAKMQGVGLVRAESVWKAWEDWEFGQKREPSRWLTLVCQRSHARLT